MVFDVPELKKAVQELAFDVQHFRCYVQLYKKPKLRQVCPAAYQAVIYSLLLHLRVLLDFFYGPPKKDDCWVRHFSVLPEFSAAFPSKILSPAPHEARELSLTLHKRLAHLTATRWEKPPRSMDYYEQYFDGINTLIDQFTAALPTDNQNDFPGRSSKMGGESPTHHLDQTPNA